MAGPRNALSKLQRGFQHRYGSMLWLLLKDCARLQAGLNLRPSLQDVQVDEDPELAAAIAASLQDSSAPPGASPSASALSQGPVLSKTVDSGRATSTLQAGPQPAPNGVANGVHSRPPAGSQQSNGSSVLGSQPAGMHMPWDVLPLPKSLMRQQKRSQSNVTSRLQGFQSEQSIDETRMCASRPDA